MNLGGAVHVNRTGLCIICGVCLIVFYYVVSTRSPSSPDGLHDEQIDLRKLLAVAIKAAQNGGREVVAAKDSLRIESKGLTKEGANDSVTTADYRSHCSMKSTLLHHFPELTVVSEEAKTTCDPKQPVDFGEPERADVGDLHEAWMDRRDIIVWIDPLDATQEYTEKLYKYVTTMVCVAVKGIPVIGVIHNPFDGETSWAWVGNGKSSNLVIGRNVDASKLRFIISRSHSGKVKEVLADSFKSEDKEFIIAGGAGYKVLEVVKGNADAYVHSTAIKKWDICAGDAILRSIGGKMTTRDNVAITYSNGDEAVNSEGLVATFKNHDDFIGKLKTKVF